MHHQCDSRSCNDNVECFTMHRIIDFPRHVYQFIVCCFILLSGLSVFTQQSRATETNQLSLAIQTLLEDEAALSLPIRQEIAALRLYYIDNQGQPLWVGYSRGSSLVQSLRNSFLEGLEPSAYPTSVMDSTIQVASKLKPSGQAKVELYFSAIFLRFAKDLKIGRLLPSKVDPKLYWRKKEFNSLAAFVMAGQESDFNKFISRFQPQISEYAKLKQGLAFYKRVQKAGGWSSVPHSDVVIRPGDTNAIIPAIHARLEASDEEVHEDRDRESPEYDKYLVEAVKRFQKMHGLEPDGVIGKQTLFAFNIPVEDRIRQIIVTMERWRWKPENLGRDHILVNIAGYELRRVSNYRIEEVMRVAVGQPFHQTPVFSNEIKYLEINPYWNVPRSIAVNEELRKLKTNPAAREASGFEVVIGGKAVPLTAIDWSSVSATSFNYHLRQRPGPKNALGRVKFMFPNRFNVYLHDTPARSLFAKAQRAFSHGCIRLARPLDLAEQVLRTVPGWNRQRIEDTISSRERKVVKLTKPLPVHITYSTVWLDEGGQLQFRPDVYRRDAKLESALSGKVVSF